MLGRPRLAAAIKAVAPLCDAPLATEALAALLRSELATLASGTDVPRVTRLAAVRDLLATLPVASRASGAASQAGGRAARMRATLQAGETAPPAKTGRA